MKKDIIWLIQSNQITPTICEFLKTLQTRMANHLNLKFMVPDSSFDILEKIKILKPESFKTSARTATNSYQGYLAKREILKDKKFNEGLGFSDVLLLDDLGGGNVMQTFIELAKPAGTRGLILQIPSPLGSSETEERVFHAAILWANQNCIPVIGYELLPLDTRWTLAPSLLDGIITRYHESYDYLKTIINHKNIWLLPFYEASIFSSVSDEFNLNGARAAYHYRNECSIPARRTVLYVPHNVAMIYEYQEMLNIIEPVGDKLHLMFGFGEDQVRGTYSQKEIIKTVYRNELKKFASYSFHNMNNPWEMLMAESLIACSACFQTNVAQEKNIPGLIFDPLLPALDRGYKKRVNQKNEFLNAVKQSIELKQKKTELGDIIMLLTNKQGK
ncbi:MAG: hypothetical protein A2277_01625 [Desulfobacterales bacterium RIFOXYA12_FULL_46_15]|nr:MAG: hypothetical protein A2097_08785 [Desulfobacula sp. GWF2_41_7]OGR22521.1 MAG: hypothetical protein A2277_01625 [Desulfobacterales bacterium RIFOXYA12_FULL_46_15]